MVWPSNNQILTFTSHPWFECCVKNPRTRLALWRQQVYQFAIAFAKVLQSPQNLLQHFINRFYTNLQCICYGCTLSWVNHLRSFSPAFNERFRIFVDLWSAMSARCTSQPLWVQICVRCTSCEFCSCRVWFFGFRVCCLLNDTLGVVISASMSKANL
jgi:hypothetical protein